jgi:hypothetical protein
MVMIMQRHGARKQLIGKELVAGAETPRLCQGRRRLSR